MTAKAGAVLEWKLTVARPALRAAAARLWAAPEPRARYLEYLVAMHGLIRASVPLMEAAVAHCAAMPADPVSAPLAGYLSGHVIEEHGHERWLQEDLAAAGADAGPLLAICPPASTAALVGRQYYWLRHYHPVTLLGYIAVLEGDPPAPSLVGHLMSSTGLPRSCFRCLDRHAGLDPGHREELFTLLDKLPMTTAQQAAIGLSALHTVRAVTDMFTELATRDMVPEPAL